MERLDEMRIRASSLPYGAERVALRREIWRMRKELEERKSLETQEAGGGVTRSRAEGSAMEGIDHNKN